MTIKRFAKAALRLLCSPVVGVIAAYKEANSRPKAADWKEFIRNEIHVYFLPLTGAIKGVRNELKRAIK